MGATQKSWFNPYSEKFRKPFKDLGKKIHEATGKAFPGGAVKNPPEGDKGSADFRQVGKSPEDKSGFPVKHLGDEK
jgi:hypothetical protein